jgi:hypothetical protein
MGKWTLVYNKFNFTFIHRHYAQWWRLRVKDFTNKYVGLQVLPVDSDKASLQNVICNVFFFIFKVRQWIMPYQSIIKEISRIFH